MKKHLFFLMAIAITTASLTAMEDQKPAHKKQKTVEFYTKDEAIQLGSILLESADIFDESAKDILQEYLNDACNKTENKTIRSDDFESFMSNLREAFSGQADQPAENIEPKPEKEQTVKEKKVQLIVNDNDTCMICQETVKELTMNKIVITNCCKQFICTDDLSNLQKKATEFYDMLTNPERKADRQQYGESDDFTGWPKEIREYPECPNCRHYPLKVLYPEL